MNPLHLLPFDVNALGRRAAATAAIAVAAAILMLVAVEEAAGAARLALEPHTGKLAAALIVAGSLLAVAGLLIGALVIVLKRRQRSVQVRTNATVQTVASLAPVALSVMARQKTLSRLSGLLVVGALAYAAGRSRTDV